MEDIRMVATKAQYAKLKPQLDAAFSDVMRSMELEGGPQVAAFARSLESFLHVRHAFPCASGLGALVLALQALRLPSGAEVILPAFAYASLAEVVLQQGLKPVFADVDAGSFSMHPASVERALTEATAAIVPVHLFGQCAPMHELMALAEKHKLWVVEDSSQALGAVYVGPDGVECKAGAIGHVGVTSFFPPKPEGGEGDGGAVVTSNSELAERIQLLLTGSEAAEKYAPLPTLEAAMLDVKIRYMADYIAARQKIARFYDNAFAEDKLVQAPQHVAFSSHIYQQYTITVAPEVRDGLRQYLRDNYIPSVVYYPEPLHLREENGFLGYQPGDLPVAECLSRSVLSLPMHSELKEDQLAYICQHVLNYVKQGH